MMELSIFMILRCDDCCAVDAIQRDAPISIGFIAYTTCFMTAHCSFACENSISISHFDMPLDDFLEGFIADFRGRGGGDS